jgi:hypothetical protein
MSSLIAIGAILLGFAAILGLAFWRGAKAARDGQMKDSLQDLTKAQKRQAEAITNAPRGADLPSKLRDGGAL